MTETDVLVNGVRLRVAQAGAGPGAVVFSHGLFLTHHLFDAPVAGLSDRYRCVAYDHRGQGGSEVDPHRQAIGVETLYDDALALVRALDLAPCHWVGQSVGGYVGMRLAARHPELVRSLVLLSPRIHRNPASFVRRMDLMCAVLTAAHPIRPLDYAIRHALGRYGMRELLGATFLADPAKASARESFFADFTARAVPALVPAVRGIVRYPENTVDMLARISAPTMIIAGLDDPSPPSGGVAHAQQVQAAIPGSRLLVVPAAGHALLIEQPEQVTRAIDGFLT
jgi:3-oxoadipate enol-lactonase